MTININEVPTSIPTVSGDDLVAQVEAARDQAQTAAANAQASALTCATWAVLSTLTGSTAGVGAEVLDSDGGNHTDPVAGGTVSNAGRYTWSASPAGWRRIGDTGLSGKASIASLAAGGTFHMWRDGTPWESGLLNADTKTYVCLASAPEAGQIAGLVVRSAVAGTLKLKIWSLSGGTYSQVSEVSLTCAVGLNTFTTAEIGQLMIGAGQFVALRGSASGVLQYSYANIHTPADGGGYAYATGDASGGTSLPLISEARIEAQIIVTRTSQDVTGPRFASVEAAAANGGGVALVAKTYGRRGFLDSGSASSAGTYFYGEPASRAGRITALRIRALEAGVVKICRYRKSGNTFTRVKEGTPVSVSVGAQTIALNIPYDAGDYLGFDADDGTFSYFFSGGPDDNGGLYGVARNAYLTELVTVTNPTLYTGICYAIALDCEEITSQPTPARLGLPTMSGLSQPLYVCCDGNSITAGINATTPWPGLLQTSLGVPVDAFGVSGQTTQQMSADAAAQIDPRAAVTHRLPVLIAQEMLNDARVNSLTAIQAVDNMQAYCLDRRAAGWKVGVTNLIDVEPSGSFVAGMVAAINAELERRWAYFADFHIDLWADPRLRDRTKTEFFQTDKIHPTNGGHAVIAERVRLAIREWMLRI